MAVDPQPQEQSTSEQPMDIDQPQASDRGVKRPAEELRPADVNKKARIGVFRVGPTTRLICIIKNHRRYLLRG